MKFESYLTFFGCCGSGDGEGIFRRPIEVERKALSLTYVFVFVFVFVLIFRRPIEVEKEGIVAYLPPK